MTIASRMRGALKDSMKARDAVRTNVLRYWIAQLTAGTGEELPDAEAEKKMRGVLKEAKSGQTTWKPEELAVIAEWLPANLDPDAIRAALASQAEAIRAAPKEGMAIGLAMKALAGQPVDSDDVRAAVTAIRGEGS